MKYSIDKELGATIFVGLVLEAVMICGILGAVELTIFIGGV